MSKTKLSKAERQMHRRNCLTAIVLLAVVVAFAVSVFVVRFSKNATPLPPNESSWQGAVQQMMEGEGTPVPPTPGTTPPAVQPVQ